MCFEYSFVQEVVNVGTLGLRVVQRWVDCERTGGVGRLVGGSGIEEEVERGRMVGNVGPMGGFEGEGLWVTAKTG